MAVNKKVSKKNIDMYKCKSYYNDDNKLVDCTCGNCWEEKKPRKTRATSKKMVNNIKVLTPGFKKIEVNQSPMWDLSDKSHIDWDKKWDEIGVDNDPGIDVPLHARGGHFSWNFEKKSMPWYNKVTWGLTAVNVAILISLVIKNG